MTSACAADLKKNDLNSFLIIDKTAKVMCKRFRFGIMPIIEFLEFWPLPLEQ